MPRMGIGMPLAATQAQAAVVIIDDDIFTSFNAGEICLNYTQFKTNNALRSQDMINNKWTKTNSTVSGTLHEAPDNSGTANAILNSDNANNAKNIGQNVAIGADKTYSASVYLKKQTFGFGRLRVSDGTNLYFADFNLTSGVVGTTSGNLISNYIDALDSSLGGGGWFRCGITFQAIAGSDSAETEENTPGVLAAFSLSADNTTNLQVATPVILMYAWGWQLEQDIEASPYIPTTDSVVRVADGLADQNDVWDFDGADQMPEEDPKAEGIWELDGNGDLVPEDV